MQTDSDPSKQDNIVDIDRLGAASAKALPPMSRTEVIAAANTAARTIAPLWPLETFVAVNPFLGISSLPYADAENAVDRIWGARLVMPRSFYADAIREQQIALDDIAEALSELPDEIAGDYLPDSVRTLAFTDEPETFPTPTVADLIAQESDEDWQDYVVDRVSFWAASHFDDGQAGWRSPWRHQKPYAAWRSEAEIDQSPEIMGIPEFRSIVRTLPNDADELLHRAATELGLQPEAFSTYTRRLLATIAGWAGHARFRGWHHELAGRSDATVKEMLAIRAAWDLALLEAFSSRYPNVAEELRRRLTTPLHPDVTRAHAINLILHTAYEIAGRKNLLADLTDDGGETPQDADSVTQQDAARPSAQAVFCIDVRSERYRRALEATSPGIETFGFAGFFGFALEVASADATSGGAQCPVLLEPQFLVQETAPGASESEHARLAQKTWLGRRVAAAWKTFSGGAISSFAFVEALGLTFAWKLIADTLGLAKSRPNDELVPSVEAKSVAGRDAGIPLKQRIEMARGVLASMSLGSNLAPVVALIGHGSTTTNNPYATRFNCGACGGHTGEANALVAAQVLNDPQVRQALAAEGVVIPDDTLFVAGLHDTTTDKVRLLVSEVPVSHAARIELLRDAFRAAGSANRRERGATFGLPASERTEAALLRRSTDWSEIRPEWGLAGCMAFIAAPRERTREVNLGGRSFLHSYNWDADAEFATLELIMTAPLVVASWISLQYYASTVDNDVFGSGDKTLHNVVGGLGVIEGTGGDLRVGLPRQSLHDGERFVHQPMRLNAFIEAPVAAISAVLEKHDQLRELIDNGWIHLFAITNEGKNIERYRGDGGWTAVTPDALPGAAANDGTRVRRSA